jgi:hypothetical protein
VTLIAAFRCDADGHPGVVVCADSQETAGDYRVTVDKIKPRDAGNYDLIIGGSGSIAALIDGLANAVEARVTRWNAGLDEEAARLGIEDVLIAYHARHVTHYPDDPSVPNYKCLRFIICVRDKATQQIYLWRTDGTTAERVEDWALLGWEEAAYHYEVKWLYYPRMWAGQAVLLGVHLFTVAQNSLYIGGPTQVIVVRDNGMHVQDPQDIRTLEERVSTFNKAIAELMLACPDATIHRDEFRGLLANFEDRVMQLREHYLGGAAARLLERALSDPNYKGEAIPMLPLGTLVDVTADGQARIMSEEETRAYILGAANPLIPDDAESEGEPPPSDTETSEGQPSE